MIIPKSKEWRELLNGYYDTEEYSALSNLVEREYSSGVCFPPKEWIFRAMDECDLNNIKAVIIGQDPYYTYGHANGLCFSSLNENLPPSLKNIYKAILHDYPNIELSGGDLTSWAHQGVLLLNTCLTVASGVPLSHAHLGWEQLTARIVTALNERDNIVFFLWGKHAEMLVSEEMRRAENCYLIAPHPSPLSAYKGFLDCGHFEKCNDFLQFKGLTPINWSIAKKP